MDTIGRTSVLRAPFTVCLWVTDFCNLKCKYCYAMPFSGKRMETSRLMRLVDECAKQGVFDLTIAGGEPLLHPDIVQVIARAGQGGLRVGLLTNGLLLTRALAEEIAAVTEKQNFLIQISLDSADATVNDVARGGGSAVIANIRALEGLPLDLQVACVIHKANVNHAHKIIDAFYPQVKRFHFLNIQKTAEALRHPELMLTENECRDFWAGLNEYRRQFPPDLFLPSLRVQIRAAGTALIEPEFSLHDDASFECESCSAGWTHINVDADFNMLGCDIAKDFTFMGNLRDQSFVDVWRSERADRVRHAPLPACYRIQGPDGTSLQDFVKPEFITLELGHDTIRKPLRKH
jgi:MoaA/NifB/PqqE/SkfB family radical SAM enzyme